MASCAILWLQRQKMIISRQMSYCPIDSACRTALSVERMSFEHCMLEQRSEYLSISTMWIDQMVPVLDAPICHCLLVDEGDLSSSALTQMEFSVRPSLLGSFQRKVQYSYCAVLYMCPCWSHGHLGTAGKRSRGSMPLIS